MILCMYLVKHRELLTTHQTCLSGFVYDLYCPCELLHENLKLYYYAQIRETKVI